MELDQRTRMVAGYNLGLR